MVLHDLVLSGQCSTYTCGEAPKVSRGSFFLNELPPLTPPPKKKKNCLSLLTLAGSESQEPAGVGALANEEFG